MFSAFKEKPDSWQARAADILLSNGMIELLRTLNPSLHRELPGHLVRHVERPSG